MISKKARIAEAVYQYHQEGHSYLGVSLLTVFVISGWICFTRSLAAQWWTDPTWGCYLFAGIIAIAGSRLALIGILLLCLVWNCSCNAVFQWAEKARVEITRS